MLDEQVRTNDLISSDRVEDTAVFSVNADKIGHVKKLLIEKHSGKVTDAIISVGGFLGIGGELHSMPWSKLEYKTDLGGYQIDVTEDQLRKAPTFAESAPDTIFDRAYQAKVYSHYGVAPFW